MSSPGIGIEITQPLRVDQAGNEAKLPYQDIEIAGNRDSLLHLADQIRKVAESEQIGYHTHLFPDDPAPNVLRTSDYSLTITLNSTKGTIPNSPDAR